MSEKQYQVTQGGMIISDEPLSLEDAQNMIDEYHDEGYTSEFEIEEIEPREQTRAEMLIEAAIISVLALSLMAALASLSGVIQ